MTAMPSQPGPRTPHRVRIGRIWIDAVTFDQALEAIAGLVQRGQGGSVFTPNVDHVVLAEENDAFGAAYAETSISVADGQPVVWASKLLGTPVPEKISGSDLIEPVLKMAGRSGWRVYLLGGAPGVAAEAGERARRDFGVDVVGTSSPYVRLDGSPGDLDQGAPEISPVRPDLVLVALGSPKQEIWIQHNLGRLRPAVVMGVGASFDFLVGRIKRAPRWISRSGFEWLFRLAKEPRRLAHRYLVKDPKFFSIVLRTARSPRSARVAPPR